MLTDVSCEYDGVAYDLHEVYVSPACDDGAYNDAGQPLLTATCLERGVWSVDIETCEGMTSSTRRFQEYITSSNRHRAEVCLELTVNDVATALCLYVLGKHM